MERKIGEVFDYDGVKLKVMKEKKYLAQVVILMIKEFHAVSEE